MSGEKEWPLYEWDRFMDETKGTTAERLLCVY